MVERPQERPRSLVIVGSCSAPTEIVVAVFDPEQLGCDAEILGCATMLPKASRGLQIAPQTSSRAAITQCSVIPDHGEAGPALSGPQVHFAGHTEVDLHHPHRIYFYTPNLHSSTSSRGVKGQRSAGRMVRGAQ